MRLDRWKRAAALCLSAAMMTSFPARADQVVITPLDAGSISTAAGQAPGNSQNQAGPAGQSAAPSTQGPAAQSETKAAQTDSAQNSAAQSGGAGSGAQAQAVQIAKPEIASEGALVMEDSTGKVLFSKNGDTAYYPASITKLMTALLTAESCGLGDTVNFSASATTNLESGAVSIGMTEGDQLTVEQCLYALLLKSANEVGNALAEHISGSNAAFAEKMNNRAASLGCTATHFTNPHGLNDTNHTTTAHDMALIARAAFRNETVRKIASTRSYTLPATKKNPSGLTVTMGHKMMNPSDYRYYNGILGGKTGYTSKAGNTLVTVTERDGVRLIAVVLKSRSTHYTDTKALLDYGYEAVKAGALGGAVQETAGQSAGQQTASGAPAAPTGTTAATGGKSEGVNGGPGVSTQRGWIQDAKGWQYVKDNGTRASGEWVSDQGSAYWIDDTTYMAKGWREVNGEWYYLRSNGAMAKNYWAQDSAGVWYYLGENGTMLKNTTTPDGYRVGADGAWRAGN